MRKSLPLYGFVLLLGTHLSAQKPALVVDIDPAHGRVFIPDEVLGTSIDILPQSDLDKVYSPEILRESLSAGWGPITYRLYTELQITSWHWNDAGTWSDAANKQGYFVGSGTPDGFLRHSFAYQLPHRGTTVNDGAERGYSRITDGDETTYWKSNPYLAEKYTRESDAKHPQWVVLDLGAPEPVSAVRIHWVNPYATQFSVEYWAGSTSEAESDPYHHPAQGKWIAFPKTASMQGSAGAQTVRLADAPMTVRYLRIFMSQSSNTCDSHGSDDPRNCVGYAIAELDAGNMTASGEFVDLVRHRPDANQSATAVSSIDPWHASTNLDHSVGDQTGMDLFFTSGITNHLPAMVPIALLYATPENAAAQVKYLEARHYPVAYVEMGEEADGQYMQPEDYTALYVQFAKAIHAVDPAVRLGGPAFQGSNDDIEAWPDATGNASWLNRFLGYLKSHQAMQDLTFFSFEHYPYENCNVSVADIYREPEHVEHILDAWRKDGLPENVPTMITESNMSPSLTPSMAELPSALWLADNVGSFLQAGGGALYHSPIQPEPLRSGCHGYSTYGNFVADRGLKIRAHTAQYYASQLINKEWVGKRDGKHTLAPVAAKLTDEAGHQLITAYAVHRPDGEWAVMVVNRDVTNAHTVPVEFVDQSGKRHRFTGEVEINSFGPEQYVWRSSGENSHPDPNLPPSVNHVHADAQTQFELPAESVNILRGNVE
jgi:hypothetical protein